jgi:organic radical activating enzyme
MGEVNPFGQGYPVSIVRFQGCSLHCPWCDTPEAQAPKIGASMSIDRIVDAVLDLDTEFALITGGEPYEQKLGLNELMNRLIESGVDVCVETNGLHKYEHFCGMALVADWKPSLPQYTSARFNKLKNQLIGRDYIKFIITNEDDFNVVLNLKDISLMLPKLVFSAVNSKKMSSKKLAQLLLNQNVIQQYFLNVQIHKLIGLKEK